MLVYGSEREEKISDKTASVRKAGWQPLKVVIGTVLNDITGEG